MSAPLLDTHAFLWLVSDDPQLPQKTALLLEKEPILYVSSLTLWEISIKHGLGKLDLLVPIERMFGKELEERAIQVLVPEPSNFVAYAKLPTKGGLHRDPFDRMLCVQAKQRNLELVSADERLDAYGIKRIWD